MDEASGFLELLGLMAVLASAAVIFVTLLQLVAGRRRSRILLGAEVAVFCGLLHLLHKPVLTYLGLADFSDDAAKAVAALFWIALAFALNAAVDKYVWRGVLSRHGQPAMPKLLVQFASVFVYVAALMVILHFVYGEPITAIAATSGAVAFVIGYSAQATLGELFAGASLQAARSLKKGDVIKMGDIFGVVHDVDWRSVMFKEFATGSLRVMPNSKLASTDFSNLSLPDETIRNSFLFATEFTAPPDLVVRAVTAELRRCPAIQQTPPPFVHVWEFGTLGMEYRVMYFMADVSDWWASQDQAYSAVWAALRKQGIKPGLNHSFAGPGGAFDDNAWNRRNGPQGEERAALASSDLLAGLDADQVDALLADAQRQDFVPPEIISRRGIADGSLLVLARGRGAALLPVDGDSDGDGAETFVANEIVPGELMGVRAYLAGVARSEEVQCLDYAVSYVFPKASVDALLARHPEIRQRLAGGIPARDAEADRRRKAHRVEQTRKARLRRKRQVSLSLSKRLSGALRGGLLAGLGKGPSKMRIAEAAMASAALVAAADGVIEPQERASVVEAFKDLDLFRFIDADKGLERFDRFCQAIEADQKAGTEAAFAAVRQVAGQADLARLVLDIGIAVSAADGEVEEPEEKRLAELRRALDLGAED